MECNNTKVLSILILRGCTLKQKPIEPVLWSSLFQSSFCEDAPWNIWSFFPPLIISYTFNPHFARMHLETACTFEEPQSCLCFQSSFCEDAPWNSWNSSTDHDSNVLSILILRGCTLKHGGSINSAIWTIAFNPHFARMHLETRPWSLPTC